MTDITVTAEPTPDVPARNAPVQIPVTKGGGSVEIYTDELSDEVYRAALLLGLKELVNRGMSKISVKGLSGADLDKAREAAMAKGRENAAKIQDGTVRLPGQKAASSGKIPKALQAEARRLAREVVKDQLRKLGKKISHYTAKAITEAADALIAADPTYLKQAEANLATRNAPPAGIDITSLIKEDEGLVKKAAAKKKETSVPLSAKQAGLTAKHKPAGATAH